MAIDLIVQHVHSQLEEVRAACEGWGDPRGGEVGVGWLPSVPLGCPHQFLRALLLQPGGACLVPASTNPRCTLRSCSSFHLPGTASDPRTKQPSSSDAGPAPSVTPSPVALLLSGSGFSSSPLAATAALLATQSPVSHSLGASRGEQNLKKK